MAARAGVTSKGASLEELVRQARGATATPQAAEAFRAHLRRCHIEVQKDLWALDESAGKAYELGGGLSDTYGRVCRAYRRDAEDTLATWEDVFLAARVERLKKLLDDLQTRLNMAGVTVVRAQLDAWSAGVAARLRACGLPREETVRDGPAAPDRDLAPAPDRRQVARGLPRPRRPRRAPRRPARADLAPLPALGVDAARRS